MEDELFQLPAPELPAALESQLATAPAVLIRWAAAVPLRQRAVAVEFVRRWRGNGNGRRILAAYVRHAKERLASNPRYRIAPGRFGHGVPYAEGLEITNNVIPYFVAAIAAAVPELAARVKVRGRAAVALGKLDWRPDYEA